MLALREEILLNQYAQGVVEEYVILNFFKQMDSHYKSHFLEEIGALITQSKPLSEDVEEAIHRSQLKPSFTPCVLLKQSILPHQLVRISRLPINEQEKAFVLLVNLFKIAYSRRYKQEKGAPSKWWYWDLSNEQNMKKIREMFT